MSLTSIESTASSPKKGTKEIKQELRASSPSENKAPPSSARRGHRRVVSCVNLEEMGLRTIGLSVIGSHEIDLLVIPTVTGRRRSNGKGTSPVTLEKKVVSWTSPESKPKEPDERVGQAARPALSAMPLQAHYATL